MQDAGQNNYFTLHAICLKIGKIRIESNVKKSKYEFLKAHRLYRVKEKFIDALVFRTTTGKNLEVQKPKSTCPNYRLVRLKWHIQFSHFCFVVAWPFFFLSTSLLSLQSGAGFSEV